MNTWMKSMCEENEELRQRNQQLERDLLALSLERSGPSSSPPGQPSMDGQR